MAATEAIVASAEAGDWTARQRPSDGHQRDPRFHEGKPCGFYVPAPRGGTCPSALVPGPRWPAVSTGGGGKDCGTGFWLRCNGKPMPSDKSGGKSITWTAPTCGRISTQLGQKGGGRSGAGPFPGRVRDQNPSEGRGPGQAGGLRADPGSAA